jgi:hypothetical protein
MIARIHPLMGVWHCSAQPVRKWISTYPLRTNGNWMTGEEEHYLLLLLTINGSDYSTDLSWWLMVYEISPSDPEATRARCFIV